MRQKVLKYQGFCWDTCHVFPSCFSLRTFLIFIQYSYFSILHTGANFYHQTTTSAFVSTTSPAHPQNPNSLWLFCICFSTSGTSVGEVFPRKHLKLSPLHVVPLTAYLSLLLWTLSYESSFNYRTSDHCPFGNPTSCFDFERIKPASQWKMAFVPLGCFLLLGVTRKAPDSGFHPLFESTEVVFEAGLTHIHPGPPGSPGLPSTWFVSAFWASTHFLTCAQNPPRRTLFLQLEVEFLFKWDSIGEKENVKLKASPL